MRKFIAIIVLLFPIIAVGQTLDTRGLTKDQVAELQAQMQKMKTPEGVSAQARKEVAAWSELGTNIGTALVATAKEIGVAANEFSQTNLGKVATVIIVYKMVGRDALGIVVGSFIFVSGFAMAMWLVCTKSFGDMKYDYKPMLWGLWQRRVVTEYNVSSDAVQGKMLCGAFVIIVSLVIGLNCIF